MPRPLKYPIKKELGLTKDLISDIDEWREEQPSKISLSEAIRRLIQLGLDKNTSK